MLRLLTLAALLAPLPALAHGAGAHVHGVAAGLLHPVGGLDHILAMVAVGLWAGLTGGRAVLALPAAFLGGMALGGGLGMAGTGLPMMEAGILASVIILGALVAGATRLPLRVGLPLVAAFGLLHGNAHGLELAAGTGAPGYALGFLLATAALHGAGLLAARHLALLPVRLAGGAMAAVMLAVILL
ncbi:HupE/UreJ family protein [Falsiroseomonas selenitidurans]|uniref:HupE/UreJ family protein n=1 Tax=Falsiroseomonas selenitidurans TaxID=2716335 RepID=A0ABX1DZ05_9PROT|nr:HupE/UreJ family protein [Falsiroseomonas selenitidurans]NKC30061.1 HupE/UreJ family protein [Falsiroseomonas selenitidurans]